MENPKIRFKGFTKDWEQRKFSDIASRESVSRESSYDLPSLEYEDVIAEEGRLNKDISLKENIKKGIVFDGSQVLYGKLRPYLHNWLNPDFSGVAVGDWWVLKPNNADKSFIYRLIQTQRFDDIANQSAGSKMPRADWNLVSNTEFAVPVSQEEQEKIGEYFSSLDHLITLHQRKCEQTKKLKKYMLQKMFPQNGAKVPEIRFDGFTYDWEQRKLGDMGSTYTGLSGRTKEDFGHGDAKFITYMNVFSNPVANLDMTESVEIDSKQNCVKAGDVFFTTSSETPEEVGMSCVMPENADNIYLNSFCFGYRPTEKFDLNYLAYVLRAESFRKEMTFLAQGISRYNISKNKVMEVEISIPSLDEQSRVGQYFSDLDHLITLHQRKCDELKKMKKYMLQNMFI